MTETQFRRWVVPSLIMLVAILLTKLVPEGGLIFGWIGGAIASYQWPEEDSQ